MTTLATETREAPVREAPEARPAWPHREGDFLGSAVCQNCDMPWPCPSQRYLDGLFSPDRVIEAIRAGLLHAGLGSGVSLGVPERIGPHVAALLARRALLDPEPKP